MKIVTVKLPEELVDLIDDLVTKLKYSNRSEFIREAIRQYIQQLLQKGIVSPADILRTSAKGRSSKIKVITLEG